eukprot:scaffold77932_cov71-Phaeocystis_antarctica.AAC.4
MEVIPCGAGWIVTKLKAIAERMLPPVITACRRRASTFTWMPRTIGLLRRSCRSRNAYTR